MNIAVIGANGMLGYAVSNYLKSQKENVFSITRQEFDLAKDQFNKLEKYFVDHKIDVVINCAGVIKPMIASTKIEDILRVNTVAPQNIGFICNKLGLKGFHITTDCVYSGAKGQYNEDDLFDADDVYGMSKNGGEPKNIMTLRTSIIGEENGQARSLIEWARSQKGKEVNGFLNHDWNGVTTYQVGKTILQILKSNSYKPGLYHLHSPAKVNKSELLHIFNDVYQLDLKINSVNASSTIDRTLATKYSLSKDFVQQTIKEQVSEMAEFFKNRKV